MVKKIIVLKYTKTFMESVEQLQDIYMRVQNRHSGVVFTNITRLCYIVNKVYLASKPLQSYLF